MKQYYLVRAGRLLTAFLLSLLVVVTPVVAQDEVGPDAVWQPSNDQRGELQTCYETTACSPAVVMAGLGAPVAAIEFVQSRDFFDFLIDFQESGVVDLGTIFHPYAANDNWSYAMLNGNPAFVSTRETVFPELRTLPGYAALVAQYPQAIIWGGDVGSPQATIRPGGGQRFTFVFQIVDGCHACGYVGEALVAYDFDAAGNYLGITPLGPLTDNPSQGSWPPRQIAFIESMGNYWDYQGDIWLINEDGKELRQITDTSRDCCVNWSPDGRLLYFIRKPDQDQGQTSLGTIVEYDMETELERVIYLPGVNVESALSISPDGRLLAFGSTELMGAPQSGTDVKECVHILNIETGEDIIVDCEEPGEIYDTDFSPIDQSLIVSFNLYEGFRLAFYNTPWSQARYDDDTCCRDLEFSSDGTKFFTIGGNYRDVAMVQMYERIDAAPFMLFTSGRRLAHLDLSPDGKWLVYQHDDAIEVMDLATLATVSVTVGQDPTWRPDYNPPAIVPIEDLLDRKEVIFESLETTTYETFDGVIFPEPITAFDETAARELVEGLRAADPATITPEQAAALERLVMQEETLAALLNDYTILAEDQADVVVDMASLFSGTGLLAAKASSNLASAIGDLLKKALEDFIKLLLRFIDEEDLREGLGNIFDWAIIAFDVIGDGIIDADDVPGLTEEFLERAQDDGVRALAFKELIPTLVTAAQPAVDQSVRSVSGTGEPVWTVDGQTEAAQIDLRGLTEQSAIMRELAHDVYANSLGQGRDVNEFLKDIADLVSVGSSLNVIPLIFSLQTRIQQILIDTAATSVLSGAMTCTRDAAMRSGELAFRPARFSYQCETPVPLNLGDFFDRLFSEGERSSRLGRLAPLAQSTAPEFDAALAAYRTAVADLRDALSAGDEAAVSARAEELLTAAQALSDEAAPVMARLAPDAGESGEGEMALGVALTAVRLDAFFALLAADAYLTDPEAADVAAFDDVLQKAGENVDLLGRVQAQVPLPVAPDIALPVVDAPATWPAVAGRPLDIPVTVANAGGAPFTTARLTVEIDGQLVAESALPDLVAGESTTVAPDFALDAPGRHRLRLVATAGERSDYRTVDLIVASAPSDVPAGEAIPPAETDTRDPAAGNGRLQTILFGVMAASGAVFILGLGALIWQGRKK